jgi:uncharacterized protein YlaI
VKGGEGSMSDIAMKAGVEITCSKCGTISNPNITNEDLDNNEIISLQCSNCGEPIDIKSEELISMIKQKAVEELQKYFNGK